MKSLFSRGGRDEAGTDPIAQTALLLVDKAGSSSRVVVRIHAPVSDSGKSGVWKCRVELEGLVASLNPATGVDSMQALIHALRGARQILKAELRGRKMFLELPEADVGVTMDNEISLGELFGG